MPITDYDYDLEDGPQVNWVRVWMKPERGDPSRFAVQYETTIDDERIPVIRYDAAHGPIALYVPAGPHAGFDWRGTTRRHLDAHDLLHFLGQRQRTDRPLVIVLDNASFHRSADLRRAVPDLRKRNVYLSYLPPYSPKLNAIEPVFRAVEHVDLPERRCRTAAALEAAVDEAHARVEVKVLGQPETQPGLAA